MGRGAGDSARQVAESARRSAQTSEWRADYSRRRAQNFEDGAAGEVSVAEVLAPLTVDGWYILNDRATPIGGNIDHIIVGPGGVVVGDAKTWTPRVEVRDGKLFAETRNRTSAVDGVNKQGDLVAVAWSGRIGGDGVVGGVPRAGHDAGTRIRFQGDRDRQR